MRALLGKNLSAAPYDIRCLLSDPGWPWRQHLEPVIALAKNAPARRTCQQPATRSRACRKRRAGGFGGAGELVVRALLSSAGPSNQGTGTSSRVVAFQLLAISCLQAPAIAAIVKRGGNSPYAAAATPRRRSRQEDKVTPGTLGRLRQISRLHPNQPAIGLETCAAPFWARRARRGRAGRRRP
jgi:hypothetical protein